MKLKKIARIIEIIHDLSYKRSIKRYITFPIHKLKTRGHEVVLVKSHKGLVSLPQTLIF